MTNNDSDKPKTGPRALSGAGGSMLAAADKLLTHHGNLLVPALFVAGIVAVYLLGLRVGPREASADEQQNEMRVETALVRLDQFADDGRDAETVVRSFYTDTSRRQIPLGDLARNGFVFDPRDATGESQPDHRNAISETRAGGSSALHQAVARAKRLKLQSVLSGRNGSKALISDNLLSEGQTIDGWTVSKINPRNVVLTWEGHQYVLEMPR
jgi:hypothetical protein